MHTDLINSFQILKHHQTRCIPSEVAKTYEIISKDRRKKYLIYEMGFGTIIENVSNFNIINIVMMELVDSFHTQDITIRTYQSKYKVDTTKIGHAFRLKSTGPTYRQKMLKKDTPADQYAAADRFRKKTLAQLREMVKSIKLDSEENITTFKRAFILYIQKALLCPNNSRPLDPKTLPVVLDVSNPRAMNWARHILGYLVQSIKDSRAKNQKTVDGCVFALLIIYFQETYFEEGCQDEEAQPPWLDYWKGATLQKRIEVEFEDHVGLVQQAKDRTPRKTQQKVKTMKKAGSKGFKENTLALSLENEGPSDGRILGKMKHIEEHTSPPELDSELESKSESETETENGSDPDSEETIYEDLA
ncbi:hypothetical protein PIB30_040623 [Stylosanthes scabra]|uniref:DUF1985 domain-containing protein n=1 Tax=Stylosanthes scabra TaxID=79078 RepID=A0ABU6TFF6_9FABA|nr:hypothetical protein [Stylosanthes scabra]